MAGTIIGSGVALPDDIVTNDDLTRFMDTDTEWIRSRTGVEERRLAALDQSTFGSDQRDSYTSAGFSAWLTSLLEHHPQDR